MRTVEITSGQRLGALADRAKEVEYRRLLFGPTLEPLPLPGLQSSIPRASFVSQPYLYGSGVTRPGARCLHLVRPRSMPSLFCHAGDGGPCRGTRSAAWATQNRARAPTPFPLVAMQAHEGLASGCRSVPDSSESPCQASLSIRDEVRAGQKGMACLQAFPIREHVVGGAETDGRRESGNSPGNDRVFGSWRKMPASGHLNPRGCESPGNRKATVWGLPADGARRP